MGRVSCRVTNVTASGTSCGSHCSHPTPARRGGHRHLSSPFTVASVRPARPLPAERLITERTGPGWDGTRCEDPQRPQIGGARASRPWETGRKSGPWRCDKDALCLLRGTWTEGCRRCAHTPTYRGRARSRTPSRSCRGGCSWWGRLLLFQSHPTPPSASSAPRDFSVGHCRRQRSHWDFSSLQGKACRFLGTHGTDGNSGDGGPGPTAGSGPLGTPQG